MATQPLKDHNIHIIAVGIGASTSHEELLKIATDSQSVFDIQEYSQVLSQINSLAERMCVGTYSIFYFLCIPIIYILKSWINAKLILYKQSTSML